MNLWLAQNFCFEAQEVAFREFEAMAALGEPAAQAWLDQFTKLAACLRVRVSAAAPAPALER
jgi:hypothetical protein